MSRPEHPAVVIGGGLTGLGVIRNLGRNGVDVYCVIESMDEAVYSKYCKAYLIIPKIKRDVDRLGSFLTYLKHQTGRPPVVFPTTDSALLTVGSLRGRMADFLAPLPSQEVLETLVDKRRFYQSLSEKRVPHPATIHLSLEAGNVGDMVREISFPVFVRPSYSQTFSERFHKKGFMASSETELFRHLRLLKSLEIDALVQEIIPGAATNHFFIDGCLDGDSEPVALFARRRLRMWPLWFGNSSLCVSVPVSAVRALKETIIEYLVSIRYRGVFSAEFKVDERDGIAKLLEVNARSWWYNTFPATCGVNIVHAAYLDATRENDEKQSEASEKYEVGRYVINFVNDLKCSALMVGRGQFSLRDWIYPMICRIDWAAFAKDDLGPFAKKIAMSKFLH